MNTIRETFHKSERLCSIKTISSLFENGNIFHTKLYKVVWEPGPDSMPAPVQVVFSVSKRNFKLAVTRNLIKRRMREAYRKKKGSFYEHLMAQNIHLYLAVIHKGDIVPDYITVEKSMKEVISRLITNIEKGLKTEVGSPKIL